MKYLGEISRSTLFTKLVCQDDHDRAILVCWDNVYRHVYECWTIPQMHYVRGRLRVYGRFVDSLPDLAAYLMFSHGQCVGRFCHKDPMQRAIIYSCWFNWATVNFLATGSSVYRDDLSKYLRGVLKWGDLRSWANCQTASSRRIGG